jgi:hypothetical protein
MSSASMGRVRAAALAVALTGLIGVSGTPAAAVTGGSAQPRLMYRCTVAATDLGNTIRVVYRLTTDGPHQHWHVRMWNQGQRFFAKRVVTGAEGDVRVKGITLDHRGMDHLRVSARRLGAGPTCRVALTP